MGTLFSKRIDIILEATSKTDNLLEVLRQEFPGLGDYLKRFGVNIDKLYLLGAGTQGAAYSDGKVVVKFTEDDAEAKASMRLMERAVQGVNPIIHVGKFGKLVKLGQFEGFDSQLYVIIQELQGTNLTHEERAIANIIGEFLIDYYHREESPAHRRGIGLIAIMDKTPYTENNLDRLSTQLAKIALKEVAGFGESKAALMIARDIIKAVLRLYYEAGIRFYDVQPDNLGKDRDGNYVLFDLGVSTTRGLVPAYGVVESIAAKIYNLNEFTDYSFEIID